MSAQDVAQTHYDTFNTRQWRSRARDYVDPTLVLKDAATGQELRGVDGYMQFAEGWVKAFPDGRVEQLQIGESGNKLISSFRGRGTFTGQLQTPQGTVPGNGRTLDLDFQEEIEVRSGKIVRITTYYDLNELLRQLGLA